MEFLYLAPAHYLIMDTYYDGDANYASPEIDTATI